jgi:hypothetical protein
MTYQEALEKMKLGKTVTHGDRKFAIRARGVWDVTGPELEPAALTSDDYSALDWKEAAQS